MSIRRLSQRIDYALDSLAPVNTDGAKPITGLFEKSMDDFVDLITKPAFSISDVPALLDVVKNSTGRGIDDRLLFLEKSIVLMFRLKDYQLSTKVQKYLIGLLYKDLPHPPSGYLSTLPLELAPPVVAAEEEDRVKYVYRTADGSNNNPLIPAFGKAHSPYARSVASTSTIPRAALPDPGLVFDTLLKRDKWVDHPGGISSLFFAFADLIIHSIFDTNHDDWTINEASSYLDLSVLYGSNDAQVRGVRRNDGTGKLWEDTFADKRLLMMPPSACALLVLLNRNHNFIAQRLLDINENGNFTKDIASLSEKDKTKQDDELFHRSRLVNCGYFMQIILGDYVGAILGLVRDETSWRLDPRMIIRDSNHEFIPVGEGNVVSIEFNLLYRWHATLSQRDTKWIEDFFGRAFGGKDFSEITIADFKAAAKARGQATNTKPPQEWTFGGMKRGTDNRFSDEKLAEILHDATEWRAGAFKARGIPECLRVIEIMGIMQSRKWGTCSFNEFRKFLGLKPYAKFEEWNPNPEIHTAAAALYRDIDNLELHVGLQAEETKDPGPGAGLCPGYTISRAILADAVCLTRGDRFMTTEFTPFNLTTWGFQDCQYDPEDGSYGGLLTKLLFRTLPDYYPKGSAYAHFPFLEPEFMRKHLLETAPADAAKYTWTRPRGRGATVPVDDFVGVNKVLSEEGGYRNAYGDRLFSVVEASVGRVKDTVKKTPTGTVSKADKRRSRMSLSFSASEKLSLKEISETETGLKKASATNSAVVNGTDAKPTASSSSTPSKEEEKRLKEEEKRIEEEEKQARKLDASKERLVDGVRDIGKAIFGAADPKAGKFFKEKVEELVKAKSFKKVGAKVGGKEWVLDVVKDVINLLPVHWACYELGLPLKSESNPAGVWYEHQTYGEFADIARYVYLNYEAIDDFKFRERSQATSQKAVEILRGHVDSVDSWWSVRDRLHHAHDAIKGDDHSHKLIKKLWQASGKKFTYREFAAQIFAAVVPTVALYAHSLALVVNFYLDEDKKAAKDELVRLIEAAEKEKDEAKAKESLTKVMAYVYEALRIDPPVAGVYRTATKDDVFQSGEVRAGSNVFASIVNANRDENTFDNSAFANYDRATTKPGIFSFGAKGLLTSEFFESTIPAALGAILTLKGLERGPGASGRIARFTEDFHGTKTSRFVDMKGNAGPWVDSLIVEYTTKV